MKKNIKPRERIRAGAVRSSAPHLHFEVWNKPNDYGSKINPIISYPQLNTLIRR